MHIGISQHILALLAFFLFSIVFMLSNIQSVGGAELQASATIQPINDQCVLIIGACKCQFKNNGSIVDLTPLSHTDGSWRFPFQDTKIPGHYKYSFNPCSDVTEDGETAIAMQNFTSSSKGNYYTLGKANSLAFNTDKGILYARYLAETDVKRYLSVKLICSCSKPTNLVVLGEGDKDHYNYELTSKQCCASSYCSSGLSFGSILCILFVVGVTLYIVIGILFNKFYRGATGPEIFPNYTFWADFPSLVKEGCIFTTSCCKKSDGYDEI